MFVLKKQASHRANLFDDMGKKRISRTFVLLIVLFLFSCLDNLFAIIVAAFRAYMMWHFGLVALRAGYEAWRFQFPICAALIATGVPVYVILPAYALLFLFGATLLTLRTPTLWITAAAL